MLVVAVMGGLNMVMKSSERSRVGRNNSMTKENNGVDDDVLTSETASHHMFYLISQAALAVLH